MEFWGLKQNTEMNHFYYISSEVLSLETVSEIITLQKPLALSEEAKINIQK